MKTVVISDLQLHEHQKWSRIVNGRNSRLQDGINTLEQATKLCGGGRLIVSGDFFHDSRSIAIPVLDAASQWVSYASSVCREVVLMVGNHDLSRKDGSLHSLRAFHHENVTVVDSHIVRDGMFLHAYTEDLESLREALRKQPDQSICILHQDVKGGIMNGGRVSEKGLTVEELSRFKFVLLGHFHQHQKLGENVWYIGSPYQIDKGEMGQAKCMAVIKDGELSWVPTVGVPEYRVVSYEAFRAVREYGVHFWEVICTEEERELLLNDPPVGANFEVTPAERLAVERVEAEGSVTVQDAVRAELEKMEAPHLIDVALARLS